MKHTLLFLMLLASCGPLPKDYDAIAACSGMGHKVGTAEYDECVQEESRANLLERHRAETERRHEREEQERIFRRAF